MADEGSSLSCPASPEPLGDCSANQVNYFSPATEDFPEGFGPSSLEAQPDLSDCSHSISLESRLNDFNDCNSPLQTVVSDSEQDFDIMGIAKTWNEDDAFVSAAAPSDSLDTSFLVVPRQSACYGPRPRPPSLEILGEEPDTDCEPLSDVKDINSCAGVCGLRNLGNTCFMNAGLQCLVSTMPLVNYFLLHPIEEQDFPKQGRDSSLVFQFAIMLLKIWSGHYSTLSLTDFKQALASCHSQFRDYRQHDCQEFLALMLDTLHEQLKILQLKPSSDKLDSRACEGRTADIAPECCLHGMNGEAVELYESSRSSQLSSPRSSDSAETSSSCVSAAAAAALSIRALPIPEEVKQCFGSYRTTEEREAFTFPDVEMTTSQKMVLHRNVLDSDHDNRMESSPVLEKNILSEISTMIKDSKTANVNLMSANEGLANNELCFDSNKFPRGAEHLKSRTMTRNSLDKVPDKVTNFLREAAKRNSGEDEHSKTSRNLHSNEGLSAKKPRVDQDAEDSVCRLIGSIQAIDKNQTVPAKSVDCLPVKSSIVTDCFHGTFRSTVLCATCNHVSVTHEPFMYLSLPLPRALERTFEVVLVSGLKETNVQRIHVSLNQYDCVGRLREAVLLQVGEGDRSSDELILAEVSDHHVVRVLEDQFLLRTVKENLQRSIYAFLVPLLQAFPVSGEVNADLKASADDKQKGWKSCVICLDEMSDSELLKHTSCPCLLCRSCIELSCRHQGGDGESLTCPVCYVQVKHETEFAPLDKIHEYQPVVRNLKIPVVFRVGERLAGHPRIVELPSLVHGAAVLKILQEILPTNEELEIHLVDFKGLKCSRCVYPNRCTGCLLSQEEQFHLQPGDCLAVQLTDDHSAKFLNLDEAERDAEDDVKKSCKSRSDTLALNDCLAAFCESEALDERNPWFCPSCQKNQCATKRILLQQPPAFIIIYLKRFVFHENTSIKLDNRVSFPMTGLDLSPYMSSTVNTSDDALYDLYSIVCHFGSASSGHYTSYTKHFPTGEWHYYNDETVLKRSPQEEDFRHAYILFYQRVSRGTDK